MRTRDARRTRAASVRPDVRRTRTPEIRRTRTETVGRGGTRDIAIHGIDHGMVSGCPRFEELCDRIARHLGGIVVSHTFFDRRAISKAFEECGKSLRYRTWIDSAQVARRAWPDKYARRGYNLGNIARDLGIRFRHHDAGEDARAAAEIVLRACADTAFGISGLQGMGAGAKRKRRHAETGPNSAG